MPIDLSAVPESVAILRRYAEPIAPALRSRFYEAVDRALVGEPGPGSYARACREVQPRFLVAPAVDLEVAAPAVDAAAEVTVATASLTAFAVGARPRPTASDGRTMAMTNT